jgi:DNA-binding MarR family transcriptional regulator
MGNETQNPAMPMEAPDPELLNNINKLMTYVAKIRENGEFDIFTQLFQTDYRILTYLETHPGAHPSVMADALKVTRPNIAANLRLLESKHQVERVIDEKNRRQVYVNLTPEGQQYVSMCEKQLGMLFAGWFAILGPDEVQHLFRILDLSSDPQVVTADLKKLSFGG